MTKKQGYVEYDSNNSGGDWWLTTKDWKALEKAGWKVEWRDEFLGALATRAKRYGVTLREAVEEWERVTKADATAAGCPCCGNPHNFTAYDSKGKWVESGPHGRYICEVVG